MQQSEIGQSPAVLILAYLRAHEGQFLKAKRLAVAAGLTKAKTAYFDPGNSRAASGEVYHILNSLVEQGFIDVIIDGSQKWPKRKYGIKVKKL